MIVLSYPSSFYLSFILMVKCCVVKYCRFVSSILPLSFTDEGERDLVLLRHEVGIEWLDRAKVGVRPRINFEGTFDIKLNLRHFLLRSRLIWGKVYFVSFAWFKVWFDLVCLTFFLFGQRTSQTARFTIDWGPEAYNVTSLTEKNQNSCH